METNLFVKEIVGEVLTYLDPKISLNRILSFNENIIISSGEMFPLKGKIHIFGLGKASSFQVKALIDILSSQESQLDYGEIVSYTKEGHTLNQQNIFELEGSHPVITEKNVENTMRFIEKLSSISEDDTLFFLLSGGGSALLELPIEGVKIDDLIQKYRELLLSGENINVINTQRKKLSKVKNGGLLKFIKSKNIIQLGTCDIPNEKIEDVSSGPLISTHNKTSNLKTITLASGSSLINFLCSKNSKRIKGKIYDTDLDTAVSDIIKHLPQKGESLFCGGEIPISVPKNCGQGGRNTHFVLALAMTIYKDIKNRDIKILSLGTDGGDGETDAAGAYIDYDLYCKLEGKTFLEHFNSYEYFDKVGTLIKTGPTKTNVMDLRCIWRD